MRLGYNRCLNKGICNVLKKSTPHNQELRINDFERNRFAVEGEEPLPDRVILPHRL